jgi:hypothetical protein
MKHNIELIKEIRNAYAKEEGYESFASMASNVNIVPRDVKEIAKRYAEAVNAELQAKCDKYEGLLKEIQKRCKEAGLKQVAIDDAKGMAIYHSLHLANEALCGEGEKGKCQGKDGGCVNSSVCQEFDKCMWPINQKEDK